MKKFFSIGVIFIIGTGCASTKVEAPGKTLYSAPQMKVTMVTPIKEIVPVKKGDFIATSQIQPAKMLVASENGKIDIAGSARVKISKGDRFYLAHNPEFGELYCGYKNHFKNSVGSIASHACLADSDNNGTFDKAFARAGSNSIKSPEFIYYDAEIWELNQTNSSQEIVFQITQPTEKEVFDLAYKYRGLEKKKGEKKAIFDVLTKRSDRRDWKTFPVRKAKSVVLDENKSADLDLSVFSIRIENTIHYSTDVKVVYVPQVASPDFQINSDSKGTYKPAYKISGY